MEQIEAVLVDGPVSPQALLQKIQGIDPTALNESIRYLLESGRIAWTPEGKIGMKTE
jgi:hypothetical protein